MPNRPSRVDSPHREGAARLGAQVRAARSLQSLSQQTLASQAGISLGALRALEAGRSVDPSFFTVMALVRVLQLELGELQAVALAETE